MRLEMGIIIFFLMAFSPSVTLGIESPQQSIQALLYTIQKIKVDDKVTPLQKNENGLLSSKALTFLDIETVGNKTLGKYWGKLTDYEKNAFVALLSRLFEKIAFPSSARFFADLEINYKKNEIEKDRATVKILVTHKEEGKIEIDFLMNRIKKKWLVVDVILDGVSMRNSLRSQFYKIISKKSYAELVHRMKIKLQVKR